MRFSLRVKLGFVDLRKNLRPLLTVVGSGLNFFFNF